MRYSHVSLNASASLLRRIAGWKIVFALVLATAGVSFVLNESGRAALPKPADQWAIHEWGTFTSLQNETGRAITGINTDDEPVPAFVHRVSDGLLQNSTQVPFVYFKGVRPSHVDVTMRLETPVLYFHPPELKPQARDFNVTARFRGGWLTEFYPNAVVEAPGINTNGMVFGPLRSSTVGTLAWNNLAVGGDFTGPVTDEHVWTSPRAVRAASVRTAGGEAEKFLFYRGVAHIDAPLAISQDANAGQLVIRSQCASEVSGGKALNVRSLWLVDIRADGSLAFRALPPVTLDGEGKILATVSTRFKPDDYLVDNRDILKASLQKALVGQGLFADEAQALLNTWEVSYFKSAGMRVFFMVPRKWTDFYLPLNVSVPAQITRVMVGRIELVTPKQRDALQQLGQIPPAEIKDEAVKLAANYFSKIQEFNKVMAAQADGHSNASASQDLQDLNVGRKSLAQAGVTVPKSYELYLSLGRFRNALILDEAKSRPSPGLDTFISQYGLEGYKPSNVSASLPAATVPIAASLDSRQ